MYTPSITARPCKFDISLLKNTTLNAEKNVKPRDLAISRPGSSAWHGKFQRYLKICLLCFISTTKIRSHMVMVSWSAGMQNNQNADAV